MQASEPEFDVWIELTELPQIREAIRRWGKPPQIADEYDGSLLHRHLAAWRTFVETDWAHWDISEYDHDIGCRVWIQLAIEYSGPESSRRISRAVLAFQNRGQPAISVDTKKKELVGDFKNAGRTWRPRGQPEDVRIHDFKDPELGKAIPYGVYDLLHDQGWVSVGIDHDTAEFACNSIRRWWTQMGHRRFPGAKKLLITADAGGSNSPRSRLWRLCLQQLADTLGLPVTVCHFPPGTSKWNKIEHRLFSFIASNWRGHPLTSHHAIVQLIARTTTRSGLVVRAALDPKRYRTQVTVSDEQLAAVRIKLHEFHGDWNYTISPRRR